jgi:hypothetical protein
MLIETKRPLAATAAARLGRTGLAVGALGLASSVFVVGRLLETWRVEPAPAAHHISVLGLRLSYPTANLAAVVVLGLALLGLAVIARGARAAARELIAARRLQRVLGSAEWQSLGGALVIPGEQARAFCAGLLRPRVYVSSGAVALLDEAALHALLAHEWHHARRRDPLRMIVGRVIADALFFIPGLAELTRRHQVLSEAGADESVVDGVQVNRSTLARAMLSLAEDGDSGELIGLDPARVDYLLGEPPGWRFPTFLVFAALAALGAVVAASVLAGQLAAGSATLAPPFLSSQPCVLVLAMIPAAVAVAGLRLRVTTPAGRRSSPAALVDSRPRAGSAREP